MTRTEPLPGTDPATNRTRTIYWWISAALQAVIALGLGAAALEGLWMNAFLLGAILVSTMVPHAFSRRYRIYIPPELELCTILFLFASFYLGDMRGYYTHFWWWDVALHTSSGLLLGLLGFLLVYVINQHKRVDPHLSASFVALFAFSFAVCLGALWEIFEFGLDAAFAAGMQPSLADTMTDLIVDALGALVISVAGYCYVRGHAERFLFHAIRRFVEANPRLFEPRPEAGLSRERTGANARGRASPPAPSRGSLGRSPRSWAGS